jgi:hypothetical protein
MIASSGNSTIGKRAVTAIGITSVIHHIAIRRATAAVLVTSGFPGSKSKNKIRHKLKKGPTIKKIRFDIVLRISESPAFCSTSHRHPGRIFQNNIKTVNYI